MIVKTWRNPYDNGTNLISKKEIQLNEGLTVLVGCNGAGKTTLLKNIESQAKKNKYPVHMFDGLKDTATSSFSAILGGYKEFENDTLGTGVALWTASEGEAIKINVGRQSSLYKDFLQSGFFKDKHYGLSRLFSNEEEKIETNIRIFLFDATDSGLSVDSIIEIKNLFNLVLEDAKKMNLECYIIISANEYEMARGENCFDVNTGNYVSFKTYEDYRNFIIKSRVKKEKRLEKEAKIYEKKQEKLKEEYKKKKEIIDKKIEDINKKASDESRKLTFSEERKISDLEYELKSFCRDNGLKIED